ncbi:MAG: hypothetical protein U9O49_00325 [Candidatus Thermoplasmatota archaeon]|nr:hypothetical protein [Candidatus Thermoplasmatota archaeon]
MKVKVKLLRTGEIKEVEILEGSLVKDLLAKINIKPDTSIVMIGEKPVPIDECLNGDEELTIIQVSSGG